MSKHRKPTKEELDQAIEKSKKELEDLGEHPETLPTPDPPDPEKDPETPPEESLETTEIPPEGEELETPPTPEPDYKKKFVESTREAQVLHAKSKKMDEAVDRAAELSEPTDEEMKKEYPDWDDMGDLEKKLARGEMMNSRRFKLIAEARGESKNIEAWNEKVDKFVEDPKTLVDNPQLEGRTDEFKVFATKPSRRGVDFEDLVSSFLWSVESKKPQPKKGKMFETGTGGDNEKPKPKSEKITLEQARQLRKTDYSKYRELLRAGKIETEGI